jgi:hypothetical protein
LGRWIEPLRAIENIAHDGAAEGVDRPQIVVGDGRVSDVRLQSKQDCRLQRIRILIPVYKDMIEASADGHYVLSSFRGCAPGAPAIRIIAKLPAWRRHGNMPEISEPNRH